MGKYEDIRAGLAVHSAKYGPMQTMLAIVVNVNEAEATCVVSDDEDDADGLNYEGVRLRPVLDGKTGALLIPKIGSWVIAQRIEDTEDWMVTAVGEIEKVKYVVGDLVFEIKDGFLLQKQNETLKKLLNDLIDEVKNIIVPTNSGPSGKPLNFEKFDLINQRVNNLLK